MSGVFDEPVGRREWMKGPFLLFDDLLLVLFRPSWNSRATCVFVRREEGNKGLGVSLKLLFEDLEDVRQLIVVKTKLRLLQWLVRCRTP